MSKIKKVFSEFKRDFGEDKCMVCMEPTAMKDALGGTWCEGHAHHGKVLSWGYKHGYPEIKFPPYAIGPGEYCWYTATAISAINSPSDDFMWLAFAYTEYCDELGEAA